MSTASTIALRPDLKTRESVMAAGGRVQFAVTSEFSGQTVYVRLDAKRRLPEGSAKRYEKATLEDATHVFVTEKGYGSARLGTIYPKNDAFYSSTLSRAHVWALQQITNLINGAPVSPQCKIVAEDNCGLCGRKLRDPVSCERGIGPECAGKPTGTKILHASSFYQTTLAVDVPSLEGEDVEQAMQLTEAIADRVQTARDEGASLTQAIDFARPQFVGAEDLVRHIAEKVYGMVAA